MNRLPNNDAVSCDPILEDRAAEDRADADELQQFGYRQQLQRSMGAFSSFAVSFSLISITTGIFANFGYGLRQAGPAVIWSWALVVAGQVLVALVLADLATRYPLSGYGYQWTSRLVNSHYGYFVGWLLLLQFLTGLPGVCKALADNGAALINGIFDIELGVSVITLMVIAAIAVIHLFGIRLAALVNNLGVAAELAGSILITLVLFGLNAFTRDQNWTFLFDTTNYASGQPATASAFALSLLLGAWCLTGFEAAADLAEETRQPREVVPRAILTSMLTSGIGGFLMLMALILAITDLTGVQASDAPLLRVIQDRLGMRATPLVMMVVFISIFACGLANMAATTRLIFSLARDNMLPFSGLLKTVHPIHKTPRNAILLVWGLSSIVVLVLDQFGKLGLITSISAVAGYLGYGGIVLGTLVGTRLPARAGGFQLGRLRMPIGVAALVWTLCLVAALTIPFRGAPDPYISATMTMGGIAVGALFYYFLIRTRIVLGLAGPPAGLSQAAEGESNTRSTS